MQYFEGYTFEEFEEIYGCKPYSYCNGYKVFLDDLIWYSEDRIDINWVKRRIRQAQEDGIDIRYLFETEDERYAREMRKEEEKRERMRENLRRNGIIK